MNIMERINKGSVEAVRRGYVTVGAILTEEASKEYREFESDPDGHPLENYPTVSVYLDDTSLGNKVLLIVDDPDLNPE